MHGLNLESNICLEGFLIFQNVFEHFLLVLIEFKTYFSYSFEIDKFIQINNNVGRL